MPGLPQNFDLPLVLQLTSFAVLSVQSVLINAELSKIKIRPHPQSTDKNLDKVAEALHLSRYITNVSHAIHGMCRMLKVMWIRVPFKELQLSPSPQECAFKA